MVYCSDIEFRLAEYLIKEYATEQCEHLTQCEYCFYFEFWRMFAVIGR